MTAHNIEEGWFPNEHTSTAVMVPMLTDDELHRVMNPPKLCPQCKGIIDTIHRQEGDEIVHTKRVCARCGFIEREWPVTALNDGGGADD